MGGADGVAVGTVVAGGVLIWSGLRGASVLSAVQDVIQGKKPAGANAHPIAVPAGSSGSPAGGSGATGGAAAMVAAALKEVGTREGAGNSQKYSHELGRPSEAWCADFVRWCAKQSGNSHLIPQTASAPGMAQAFGGKFVSGSAGIKAGDIVFYSGASNGWNGIGHVGIAVTDGALGWESVEGNYGDKVAHNHRFSCQGHARPNYG